MKTLFHFILCFSFLVYGLEAFSLRSAENCSSEKGAIHKICEKTDQNSKESSGHEHTSCDHCSGGHSHQFLSDHVFRTSAVESLIFTFNTHFLYEAPYLNKLVRPPSA